VATSAAPDAISSTARLIRSWSAGRAQAISRRGSEPMENRAAGTVDCRNASAVAASPDGMV
jgi:hypothetical protein